MDFFRQVKDELSWEMAGKTFAEIKAILQLPGDGRAEPENREAPAMAGGAEEL